MNLPEAASGAAIDEGSPVAPVDAERVYSRITWLLIPFMFLLYVAGYLDRINVGFAATTMQTDLGLSDRMYGFGAGIFFLGYFLLEVPSNLILERTGARRWIARIMISWGFIACLMMFARGMASFSLLRFLLGAAEAGFFPGMVLYLTYWFPAERRAKAMSAFLTATAIAGVIGSPISAACLHMRGHGHLSGWQWLFLLEGLPSIALGIGVLFFLPDGPRDAKWLSTPEKHWLLGQLDEERRRAPAHARHDLRRAITDPRLWLMCAIYFLFTAGLYTFGFFAPKMLKASAPDWSDARVSLVAGIPYVVAAVCMVVVAQHSDRTGERRWHVALSAFAACLGLCLTAFTVGPAARASALCLAAAGVWSMFGTFWTLPTAFLRGTAAAGGIALVNSIGCLAGWASPWVLGALHDHTHRYKEGLLLIACSMLVSGVLVLWSGSFEEQKEPSSQLQHEG